MTDNDIRIDPFDSAGAGPADLAALHGFTTAVRESLMPGESHTPLA